MNLDDARACVNYYFFSFFSDFSFYVNNFKCYFQKVSCGFKSLNVLTNTRILSLSLSFCLLCTKVQSLFDIVELEDRTSRNLRLNEFPNNFGGLLGWENGMRWCLNLKTEHNNNHR